MADISFRCWCCKDSAIISGHVLSLYNVRQYISPSDPAFLCQKPGCDANTVTITNNEGRDVPVKRYADYAVSREVSPDLCQWLHEKELERAKEAKEQASRPPVVEMPAMPNVKPDRPTRDRWELDPILSRELQPIGGSDVDF